MFFLRTIEKKARNFWSLFVLLNIASIATVLAKIVNMAQPINIEAYPFRFIGNAVVDTILIIMLLTDLKKIFTKEYLSNAKNRAVLGTVFTVFAIISVLTLVLAQNLMNFKIPVGIIMLIIYIVNSVAMFLTVLYPMEMKFSTNTTPKVMLIIGFIFSVIGDAAYAVNVLYEQVSNKYTFFFYLLQQTFWLLGAISFVVKRTKLPKFLNFEEEKERYEDLQLQTTELFERLTLLGKFLKHDLRNDYSVVLEYITLFEELGKKEFLEKAKQRIKLSENRTREFLEAIADTTQVQAYSINKMLQGLRYFPNIKIKGNQNIQIKGNPLLNLIVYNIVQNAYKHGRQVINVELEIKELDGYVIITISDDGPGIPKEIKTKLFKEPISSKDGRGKAMYLTKLYLDSIGATIRAEDNKPKGTKIIITLEKWKEDKGKN